MGLDDSKRRSVVASRLGLLALVVLPLVLLGWVVLAETGDSAVAETDPAESADPVGLSRAEVEEDCVGVETDPTLCEEAWSSLATLPENLSSRPVQYYPASPIPSLDDIVDRLQGSEADECIASNDRVVISAIKPNQVLSTAFAEHDLDYSLMLQIVDAFKGVFNFRLLRPGMRWRVDFNESGEFVRYMMQVDRLTALYAQRGEGERITAHTVKGEVTTVLSEIAGSIQASLSVSLWRQGETDALTQEIADIFAWDIDFYSDIQKGDTYRILVEKRYYRGEFLGYGRVLAATFDGRFMGHRSAYYFEHPGGLHAGYYDKDGNTLEKSFLRAPLNTTRVTSTYGFRFHPILKKVKPHNGIDYGAPTGTPIWAITSGKVIRAGNMGGCGIGAVLSHSGGYESIYCHMSSISVKTGQTVRQKQMLGRVGCTGYCTGPHLHFGMKKDGRYINPAKMKFEPGRPISPEYRDAFLVRRDELAERLGMIELPVFYGPDTPEGMLITEAGLVPDPKARTQPPEAPLGGGDLGDSEG